MYMNNAMNFNILIPLSKFKNDVSTIPSLVTPLVLNSYIAREVHRSLCNLYAYHL